MRILKNPAIPSTMTDAGLDYLGKMAQMVPENGTILEIGPLFGSSTWVLAKNCHPSVTVFSIDTWESAPWIEKIEAKFRNARQFSKDTFDFYTRDCPNVVSIQGWSPDVVHDWDRPIDLYFDDATHGDPGFSENLNFFMPFIRPGAFVCGDDYAQGWSDIVRIINDLGKKWKTHPEVVGRVWSLIKPEVGDDQKATKFVADLLPQSPVAVKIDIESQNGEIYALPAEVWSGAQFKYDPIRKLGLSSMGFNKSLDIAWSVTTALGKEYKNLGFTDTVAVDDGDHLVSFSAKLTGQRRSMMTIEYQIGSCNMKNKEKVLANSRLFRDGQVAATKSNTHGINSLRISVTTKSQYIRRRARTLMSIVRHQNDGFKNAAKSLVKARS